MKKIIGCIILLITITLLSCEKETLTVPNDFTASQGTYIGVVHLVYGYIEGQAIVSRYNDNNGQWEELTWTWNTVWDDDGYLLPDNKIIPGKEYRYKMRLHNDDAGFSDHSNEISGYAFKAEPVEITSIDRQIEGNYLEISIYWTNPNNLLEIKNLQQISYDIYRTEVGNYADFTKIKTVNEAINYTNDIDYDYSYTDRDYSLDRSKSYSYKIVTRYIYNYTHMSSGGTRDYNEYIVDGEAATDDGVGGNGDNQVIDYTTTDLGEVLASSSGIIIDIDEKLVDNALYVGAITDATLYGKPALYKLNGSSWQ